jgi:hypothetical protein
MLQAILAFLLRSLGRILNTAFGWATTLLFGKVPASRQIYLSAATFGSAIWLVTVLGIASPRFAAFLFAFVTLPRWFAGQWLRWVMFGAAIFIPPIVGVLSMAMVDAEDRPKGWKAKAKRVVQGYPYTFGLAISVLLTILAAPIIKIRMLVKRWSVQHVPVIVDSQDYLPVVGELDDALRERGLVTRRVRASLLVRAPTKILARFAGGLFANLIADNLTVLVGQGFEVLLHPSDLVVSGRKIQAAHARAAITERLAFSHAYLTWAKEANRTEDRLHALWSRVVVERKGALEPGSLQELKSIEDSINRLDLTYEEWEVLFRVKLQVERSLLRAAAGVDDQSSAKALDAIVRKVA